MESPASEEFNSDPQKTSPLPPKAGGQTNPEGGEEESWKYPEEEADIKAALAIADDQLRDFITVRRSIERRDGYHPGWVYRQACLLMAKAKPEEIRHPRGFFKSKIEEAVLDHGSTRPKFADPKPQPRFTDEVRSGINRWRSIADFMATDEASSYPFPPTYTREEVVMQFRERREAYLASVAKEAERKAARDRELLAYKAAKNQELSVA